MRKKVFQGNEISTLTLKITDVKKEFDNVSRIYSNDDLELELNEL